MHQTESKRVLCVSMSRATASNTQRIERHTNIKKIADDDKEEEERLEKYTFVSIIYCQTRDSGHGGVLGKVVAVRSIPCDSTTGADILVRCLHYITFGSVCVAARVNVYGLTLMDKATK